jgi:EAL domain-containing protein (putative c-di-GMP-specific phosphodiesterase class I)
MATALQHHLDENMQLFKAESDRFMIYIKGSSKKRLESFCEALFAYFDMHEIVIDEQTLFITFNIGLAEVDSVDEVMLNTEFALEASKALGTKQYVFFQASQELEKEMMKNIKMTKYLIENSAIIPYFQAIKDVRKGCIEKYEVLARGIYKDEIILPYRFLESAKQMGLITSITRMIISKSFAVFESNSADFSINITEYDLSDGYLIPYLKMKLKRHNIAPTRLTFEILENISLDMNSEDITQTLADLKSMGIKIAVDDFGMDRSNFLRLLEMDFDFLKLDGVFIRDLDQSPKTQKIVEAVINLSQTIGIKTVAEFVENQAVYEILEDLGIDFIQGYYIGRPEKTL